MAKSTYQKIYYFIVNDSPVSDQLSKKVFLFEVLNRGESCSVLDMQFHLL